MSLDGANRNRLIRGVVQNLKSGFSMALCNQHITQHLGSLENTVFPAAIQDFDNDVHVHVAILMSSCVCVMSQQLRTSTADNIHTMSGTVRGQSDPFTAGVSGRRRSGRMCHIMQGAHVFCDLHWNSSALRQIWLKLLNVLRCRCSGSGRRRGC
jgi:hypothetical protein